LFLTYYRVREKPTNGAQWRLHFNLKALSSLTDLHVCLPGSDPEPGLAQAWLSSIGAHSLESDGLCPGPQITTWQVLKRRLKGVQRRTRLWDGTGGIYAQRLQALCERVQPDLIWYDDIASLWTYGSDTTIKSTVDLYDLHAVNYARSIRQSPWPVRLWCGHDVTAFARQERALVSSTTWRTVCSELEAVILNLPNCGLIPNGLDFPALPPPGHPRTGRNVLFIGALYYGPNVAGLRWFCKSIWPKLLRLEPEAHLHVVGQAEKSLGSLPLTTPNATFHGFLPDADAIWQQSDVCIVPLKIGSGTRLKIIEAWARGVPVVSTTIGAEGLGVVSGQQALLADDPADFTEAVASVLQNSQLSTRLVKEGYEHGMAHYSSEAIGRAMRAFLNQSVFPPTAP
jgi:glycosyltransferase involved in cell wall biosynthesis